MSVTKRFPKGAGSGSIGKYFCEVVPSQVTTTSVAASKQNVIYSKEKGFPLGCLAEKLSSFPPKRETCKCFLFPAEAGTQNPSTKTTLSLEVAVCRCF